MLKSQLRILSRQSKSGVYQTKRYSSSSVPPPTQDQTESSSNLENEKSDTPTTANAAAATPDAPIKAKEPSKIKKRIRVQSSSIPTSPTNSIATTRVIKLPSVASTQYLDSSLVKKDMFYGGYRPLLTPIRKPIIRSSKKPTIPPTWNVSACRLETFDDYTNVPQFVVDKLTPFNIPQGPGNEIRLGLKSRKEEKEFEKLSKEVLQFIRHFRK